MEFSQRYFARIPTVIEHKGDVVFFVRYGLPNTI